MKESYEYQIYIGCNDSQIKNEVVSIESLEETVHTFFMRKQIDFSLFRVKGGYFHDDGTFISENTMCIDIIVTSQLDIIALAKSLSMYMNQECTLVTRNPLMVEFR